MKRILINATHNEEIRVALCKDDHLYDFDLENRTREQKKSNIYKGHVTRVEPSLEAVFVEYGAERQGFLPIREIASEYLNGNPREDNIRKLIKEGDELIVQIEKEERGNKGAALSTFVSLAGRYLVLMPNNPRGGGISRQITGRLREEMKRMLANMDLPKGMSVIVRTAGIGKTQEDLQHDLNHLLNIWNAIQEQNNRYPSPRLVHQEAGVVTRAVRDYLRDDISEIWIDSENAYNEAENFIKAVMPKQIDKLRKYTDFEPMFARFQVEKQIETAYQREVRLPSGGSIVIDQTEALVSIDINSAKSTKGSDVSETAYHTNLEAAEEIARQLRLRDMGGLVVIDFIDMSDSKHQRAVEKRLVESTKYDRARVQFGNISKFGLMEMSRQRLRPSLEESTGYICPRCHGNGVIRDLRSLSLAIMRQIEEIALKRRRGEVQAEVPTDIAAFLLNEKRESLVYLEQDSGTRITILPHAHMESPQFKLHYNEDGFVPASYERISDTQLLETTERGYEVDWQTNDAERPEQQPVRQPANHHKTDSNNTTQVAPAFSSSHASKNSQTPVNALLTDSNTSSVSNVTASQTQVHSPTTPTATVPSTQPAAVAWLANLFAPTAQAHIADSISSQQAATAIEEIVNSGAQSLGVFGSLSGVPSAKEPKVASNARPVSSSATTSPTMVDDSSASEDNETDLESRTNDKSSRRSSYDKKGKSERSSNSRDDKRKRKNRSGKSSRDRSQDRNQDDDRAQNDSSPSDHDNNTSTHTGQVEDNKANADKNLARRRPHGQRDSRGTVERGQTLSKDDRSIATQRTSDSGEAKDITLHVKEAPMQAKEPEIIHFSLDNSASNDNLSKDSVPKDSVPKDNVSKETVAPVADVTPVSTTEKADSKNELKSADSSTSVKTESTEADIETVLSDAKKIDSEHFQLEPEKKTTAVREITQSVKDDVIEQTSKAQMVTEPSTESKASESTPDRTLKFDTEALFDERYIVAHKYGLATNDPRVVKSSRSATTTQSEQSASKDSVTKSAFSSVAKNITGSVGEFIINTLEDGAQHLQEGNIISSFLTALAQLESKITQSLSTDTSVTDNTNQDLQDFDFSNYGYMPLSADYLDTFATMTSAVATYATTQGKAESVAIVVGKRASNDPRGQHPDYQDEDINPTSGNDESSGDDERFSVVEHVKDDVVKRENNELESSETSSDSIATDSLNSDTPVTAVEDNNTNSISVDSNRVNDDVDSKADTIDKVNIAIPDSQNDFEAFNQLMAGSVGRFVEQILGQTGVELLNQGNTETAFLTALKQPMTDILERLRSSDEVIDASHVDVVVNTVSTDTVNDSDTSEELPSSLSALDTETRSTTDDKQLDDSQTADKSQSNSNSEEGRNNTPDKSTSAKTSIASYKSMIENISEQLSSQLGLSSPIAIKPKSRQSDKDD